MAPAHRDLESALLSYSAPPDISSRRRRISIAAASAALIALGLLFLIQFDYGGGDGRRFVGLGSTGGEESVESEIGVVAADDGMCSEIGASMLRLGGHAVDAAVATAICSGVRHPMSSGIGGGAFIVVRSAADGNAEAFDARETAPSAASEDMYQNNPSAKSEGALSMGIPGEVAGLHAAWSKYGRLPWKSLFQPSINLARNGFLVEPYLALSINEHEDKIMADPGLRGVFAPDGKLLQLNDTCYNPELARSLEAIATDGPQALYNGRIGERFIEDTRNAGGIATMDDMRRYRVEAKEALAANVMGYTLLGMPPPSSGTAGISMVLNILGSYKTLDGVRGFLGLHRLIEATKHMLAIRMNLGDPDFVNVTKYVDDMLSPVFAEQIRQKIVDNTTFGPSYYLARWSQVRDHGTSHISIVDAERNAVSMTTTVNFYFGSGVLSPSTGIVANNEMDDFSTPTDAAPDGLPPAPSNFIEPNKRPLSSMTPLIIVKDNQVAGVIGASGGMNIIPTVAQVFINHFVLGMTPLEAVQRPRFYHKLIPNVVQYENYTALDGERFEFSEAAKGFLEERHHQLQSKAGAGAVCQFVVQDLREPVSDARVRGNHTAVRLASTAVAKQPSGGFGLFNWLTGERSRKLPPLDFPLEGVTLPPSLPDFVEAGKTKITTLPNGIKIASETSANPAASIGLYVDCGSVYETHATSGATHLLERMAFKSTTNRSHLRIVREVEAIGGNVTSSASREQMGYTYDALKTYMPEMVEVLIDCVRNPIFLDWEVNEQLEKVKAEIKEISDNPQGLLLEALHSVGYSGALANPLMAPESAINRLDSRILEEFIAENYTAPRMVLAASGVDHEELVSIAEPLLSDLPKGHCPLEPKSIYVGGDYRCQADSDKTHVALAFEIPGGWHQDKDAMTLTVLQMLMGGGGSFSAGGPGKGMYSRLYLRILNEHPQIQSFSAFNSIYNNTGIFGIHVTTSPGFVSKAVVLAARELIAVATTGEVDQAQLDRAKASTKSAILMNLESRMVASEDIGRQILTYGERKPVEHFLEAVDAVTLKDITSLSAKIISSPLTMASWGDVVHVPSYGSVSSKFRAK